MVPKRKSKPAASLPLSDQNVASDCDDVPTKEETLKDIGEGYLFVMSGGKGQPIDEMHREIADELARETRFQIPS